MAAEFCLRLSLSDANGAGAAYWRCRLAELFFGALLGVGKREVDQGRVMGQAWSVGLALMLVFAMCLWPAPARAGGSDLRWEFRYHWRDVLNIYRQLPAPALGPDPAGGSFVFPNLDSLPEPPGPKCFTFTKVQVPFQDEFDFYPEAVSTWDITWDTGICRKEYTNVPIIRTVQVQYRGTLIIELTNSAPDVLRTDFSVPAGQISFVSYAPVARDPDNDPLLYLLPDDAISGPGCISFGRAEGGFFLEPSAIGGMCFVRFRVSDRVALINSTLAIAVPPQLSISDASLTEGNSGTTDAVFTVSLSAPAPTGGVRFDLATANGTATAGSDYTATSTTGVTIPAGQSTATFTVPVNGDTTWEPDETFFVDVTNPVGVVLQDGQGQGTIRNDDTPPSDFAVITTATSIVITDATANGSTLQASEPVAGTVRFEAPGRTFSVDGGPVINGNSGNLPLTGITAIAVNAAGGTTVASGTTLNLATASYSSASALRLAGGTLRSTGTVTVAAPVVLTADSDVAAASSQALVLSGPISGDFTLRTFGAGVHRFSGVGSNFSRLNIASGAVALGATDGLPAQVDIVNSGAFDLAGFNQSIDFYAGAGATQNTGAAATLTIGTAGSTSSFGGANYVGAISGPINLVVAAGANQRLGSNSSSYTGTTTVQGTVIVTGTRALGATGPGNGTTLSSGGRIDLNNVAYAEPETLTIQGGQMFANSGSSSFPGAISVDSSGTAFIVLGTALTLDGVISGTGAVQTQGLLTLTQANMLTGPITAGLGTLLVTGSTPAASTVTSLAATLGGTGQIGGPTSVTGAGALAPGLVGGVGTLRTGNLSLAGVARAEFDIAEILGMGK